MRSETATKKVNQQRPWRLLLWATLVSLVCGAIGFTAVAEDMWRATRNNLSPQAASGDIVFVGIDDRSLSQIGKWPWDRAIQGRLVEQAKARGAERVFIDLIYDSPGPPGDDAAFERSLQVAGNVTIADRDGLGLRTDIAHTTAPLARFARHAETASITVFYNWQNAVWRLPYSTQSTRGTMKSFAAALSGRQQNISQFLIDYRITPKSIPYLSASDVLSGKAGNLDGKTLLIGLNADQLGDQYWIPGYGKMAGAYIHIIGAETLKNGSPSYYVWVYSFLVALIITLGALMIRSAKSQISVLLAGAAALLLFQFAVERMLIFVDVMPALLLVGSVAARLAWLLIRKDGLVNPVTGLPTLQALRAEKKADNHVLVVARIHNQSAISASLDEGEAREAVRQVVARLTAGEKTRLFQSDEGIFAWLLPAGAAFGNHLEALHTMFRSPLAIGARQIDIALSFGVEIGSSRGIGSRLASAILAADEAWSEGLRWKLHDPSRQEEMNWRVSLLGELDSAIDHGEVWLAYQPQHDIASGRIIGAEALARWTHPQKGPISPSEFVAAAEANGRIGKLTDFVLDRAIASAAAINRRGIPFQIAVNLSARLLTDRELLGRVKTMLDSHQLSPTLLTLELTETATLQDAESGLATLDAMRQLGIRIAIDDYGTGLSTLEYLKKIPANEIKIDQSFVKSMRVNRSDLIMVQSTIALAHSLGRIVVAEGVEDRKCLDELARMGCDIAQGFAIGRPMGVRELVQRLQMRTAQRVA